MYVPHPLPHYTLALPALEVPRTLSYGDECAIRTTSLRLAIATTAFDPNQYTAIDEHQPLPELSTHSRENNLPVLTPDRARLLHCVNANGHTAFDMN
jgi:hypothetical protein